MYSRFNPVNKLVEIRQPSWDQRHRMMTPARFKSPEEEAVYLKTLALCDLSFYPKIGVKGDQSEEWLTGKGISVPERIYDWKPMEGEGVIARIDRKEFFLEGSEGGRIVSHIAEELRVPTSRVYPVQRQDAGLLLVGARSPAVLAQTCGYDFGSARSSPFVMTRIAGVFAALLRQDVHDISGFRIWCDISYAAYLWENLLQICEQFGGSPVGFVCLKEISYL